MALLVMFLDRQRLFVQIFDLYLFTVLRPAQEFFTHMETSSSPLQNQFAFVTKSLSSALRAFFEQGGIFIVPHLL
jgi:hypothetical protein